MIQKHAATRLHYDFRLEMERVLKSWAVPKGIPFQQGERHLAVHVEDHPLDYARFEGVIPQGSYGAGTVMVWDYGEYTVEGEDPIIALEKGKLHLRLAGKKLRGEWTLVRTRTATDKDAWLLMKTGDSIRPVSRKKDDESALSGRTMRQICTSFNAPLKSLTSKSAPGAAKARKKPTLTHPAFIRPMHPKLVQRLPTGAGWVYELKLDGYRAIAVKEGLNVTLYSRNELPLRFPVLTEAVAALQCQSGVFDGEVVVLDDEGRPSFQLLHARESGEITDAESVPIFYYLFDLLQLDGTDLCSLPLTERKEKLAAFLTEAGGVLRFSGNLPGEPGDMLSQIKARGLEGIVAKRADSAYEPGLRSGAWVKVKCINEQEFVIGGYTRPKGTRSHFGSLLIGYYDQGILRFAGKVGSGFSERSLVSLSRDFKSLRAEFSPFVDLSSKLGGSREAGLSVAEMKRCIWIRPERACRIRFSEWTRDGKLRQPVFLGIRSDKPASQVTRET